MMQNNRDEEGRDQHSRRGEKGLKGGWYSRLVMDVVGSVASDDGRGGVPDAEESRRQGRDLTSQRSAALMLRRDRRSMDAGTEGKECQSEGQVKKSR